jgi:hypothetical protein
MTIGDTIVLIIGIMSTCCILLCVLNQLLPNTDMGDEPETDTDTVQNTIHEI